MSAAAAKQLARSRTPPAGRPAELPLELPLAELGLSLPFLRAAAEREHANGDVQGTKGHGIGLYDPLVGRVLGERLTTHIAHALSRPACTFRNAYVWRYERGHSQPRHTDRPGLDITMSAPLVLAGAQAWPVAVRQPDGQLLEWPGVPGTVLLFDGRWRPHWRGPFAGEHAYVLLLHWRAPAVRWRGLLAPAECARLGSSRTDRPAFVPSVLDRCADLARLAVPPSTAPTLGVYRSGFPLKPNGEDGDAQRGARLLVPLDGELAVTFEAFDPIVLNPGDGLAFPAWESATFEWRTPDRVGTVLMGRGRTPPDAPAETGSMRKAPKTAATKINKQTV